MTNIQTVLQLGHFIEYTYQQWAMNPEMCNQKIQARLATLGSPCFVRRTAEDMRDAMDESVSDIARMWLGYVLEYLHPAPCPFEDCLCSESRDLEPDGQSIREWMNRPVPRDPFNTRYEYLWMSQADQFPGCNRIACNAAYMRLYNGCLGGEEGIRAKISKWPVGNMSDFNLLCVVILCAVNDDLARQAITNIIENKLQKAGIHIQQLASNLAESGANPDALALLLEFIC